MPLDVDATEHFAAEALSISEAADDREGVSWAHAGLAFAAEARQNCRRAEQEYAAARQCLSDPKTRSSSKVHMLLYQGGFERRRLLTRTRSKSYGRQSHLALTARGRATSSPRPRHRSAGRSRVRDVQLLQSAELAPDRRLCSQWSSAQPGRDTSK